MPLTSKVGHFNLLEEIGRGGMGSVFRALDPSLNREVAIKVLREELARDPKFVTDFVREARSAAAISHPHLVQVHLVGAEAGQYYIVMELLAGRPLSEIIDKEAPLDEERALDIGIDVTEGLRAAYRSQMIHGDIKPANIFLTKDQGAKVLDFGLAKLANVEVPTAKEVWGSPYYMSPERVGQKAEDFRSDVYSLGATLFHALTGRPPFDAEEPDELAAKRLNEKPLLLRELNPNITKKTEAVVNKMLSKSALLRFLDYDALLEELRAAKTEATAKRLGVELHPGSRPAARARKPRWLSVLADAAVVVLVVTGIAVFFMKRQQGRPPKPETPATAPTTPAPAPVVSQPSPAPSAPVSDEERQKAEEARQEAERQRALEETERQLVQGLDWDIKELWPKYDFNGVLAACEAINEKLTTDEGRSVLQPRVTAARLLTQFRTQLADDFQRQPYEHADLQTLSDTTLPGKVVRTTDSQII